MRTTRTAGRLAAVLALAAAPLVASTAAAPAANASGRPHHATFRGPVAGDHKSGIAGDNVNTVKVEAGTCTETATTGALGSCSVEWSITTDICKVAPEVKVGTGSYTDSRGGTFDFELFGVGEAGSGILDGYIPLGNGIGRMHIDATDTCGALALIDTVTGATIRTTGATAAPLGATSQFTGYVDFVYVNAA